MKRSTKTRPSPKADTASLTADAMLSPSAASSQTSRMPLPPPPADALTMTG